MSRDEPSVDSARAAHTHAVTDASAAHSTALDGPGPQSPGTEATGTEATQTDGSDRPDGSQMVGGRAGRILLGVLWTLPPALAAVLVGAAGLRIGSIVPWEPFALDLSIYRRAGLDVVAGNDFYLTPSGSWPFIYPPFAALLAVPLGWLSWTVTAIVWPVINTILLMLIGRRFGINGWLLSLLTTGAVIGIEPVRATLGYGQINIVLLALVVLDSMPGQRLLRSRFLPEGWLTGLAAGIKLTPAIFAAQQLGAGRWRVTVTAFLTFVATVVIGFVLFPSGSITFWARLAGGDSGINNGIAHYTNQSVVGNAARIFGVEAQAAALPVAALAGLIGLAAAVVWHRLGEPRLALCLTGFAALVASPISWSHHYVWVVPLALVLLLTPTLPAMVQITGWPLAAYVGLAPFKALPYQDEENWGLSLRLVNSVGLVLAMLFLITCLVVGTKLMIDNRRIQQAQLNGH